MSTQKIRELSASENAAIKRGLNQVTPKLFADYSTPMPRLLVSPVKNSLLKLVIQLLLLTIVLKFTKITLKSMLSKVTVSNAVQNPLLALLLVFMTLWPLFNYFNKIRSNKNIIESMKRLPEGATKMDYISQTAVMSDRLRGGRSSGGGFSGGFLGGMLGGSMGRRRR